MKIDPIRLLCLTLLSVITLIANLSTLTVHAGDLATPTVIGGEDAADDAWPWMAGLIVSTYTSIPSHVYCGGALIADQWILTAAHCTIRNNEKLVPQDIDVVFGANDLAAEQISRSKVIKIVRHPAYFTSIIGNADIALLKLAKPTDLEPLAIANPKLSHIEGVGTLATVLGWGKTEQENRVNHLQQANVPVVSNKTCNDSYSPIGYQITDNMICAGYQAGGKDACFGDSGGPLLSFDKESDRWYHIGVVSWGRGCALTDYYGVYTRTSKFSQWIAEQIDGTGSTEERGDGPSGQSVERTLLYMPIVRS